MASQYSTPNRLRRAVPPTASDGPGRNENHAHAPSGLHADELAVKPHGTSTSRTSSAASDVPARRVRNSRVENRGFFQNPSHPDGPRGVPMAQRTPPAAAVHAPDTGTPAGGDTPCHAHWPDTAVPHATPTNAAPPGGSLRCNSAPKNEGDGTTSRTPSIDRPALGNGPGLAVAAKSNHAEPRPRESPLPKVQSRRGAIDSTPGRFFIPTSCRLL
jgi:hypothetical protein